ncbi:hypothetical protein SY83_05500 [Paenibacillus swuensis]|uniref:Uncharacterized protein n=1 Tax=Paenibacillus swuensis TaxID=1178515 RepID=A0A172TFL9_9BACL|nr:hypothetical protein [Paenibacillus swuensis]ANE45849.1 hypothetical protein SY83_05500 [Paenibacillus swuensis]
MAAMNETAFDEPQFVMLEAGLNFVSTAAVPNVEAFEQFDIAALVALFHDFIHTPLFSRFEEDAVKDAPASFFLNRYS